MKNLFVFLFLCNFLLLCHAHGGGNYEHSDMLASMKPGDKAALLMVHFGTTHDDTRALTIDAINAKAQAAFPELKFQEAYTSRIIIRRLKERGITKLTPLDAMLKLRSEGYTHLIVQSTNIIDGVEMESLRRDVENALPFLQGNTCRYSPALLYRRCRESGKYSGEPLQRPGTKQESYQRTLRPCGPRHLYPQYRHLQSDGLYAESRRTDQFPCGHHRRLSNL